MLLEVYRHAGEWRIGAVGQGFIGGLGELIEYFGGEVERPAETPAPAAPPVPAAPPSTPAAPPAPHRTVEAVSLSKTVNLSKGATVSLSKADGAPELRQVFMGLGWDPVGAAATGECEQRGFWGNLMQRASGFAYCEDIDLDVSCLMFDGSGNLLDTVWFVQLRSRDGSIQHSGDNLTGAGDGDDEVIRVDLAAIPAAVEHLIFTVNSFRGQQFTQVSRAFAAWLMR